MNFTQWKYFYKNEYVEGMCPEYSVENGVLRVELDGKEYAAAQFDSVSYDIAPGNTYRISYKLETDNPMARVLFGWYKGEEAIVKGYLNNGCGDIVCPEDVDSLRITLRFNGFDKAYGVIGQVTGECLGESKPRMVKVAAVAIPHIFYPESQPREYNMEETVKQIERLCKKHQPDIIALTETFYTRKTLEPTFKMCLPENSEPIDRIRELAKKYNTYFAFSYHESENEHIYNSGFLIDRKGEIAGKCHKCHLTMGEYENGLTPGREIKVFDTDFGKVGIAICWDIFFPEHIREMQKQGVELIINPTAGYSESRITERCCESGAYIVTAVSAGYEKTAVFNPRGKKLADASQGFGIVCEEIDLNKKYYWEWLSYSSMGETKDIYLNELRTDLL